MTDKQEREIFNAGLNAAKANYMKEKVGIVVLIKDPYRPESNLSDNAKSIMWNWGYDTFKP